MRKTRLIRGGALAVAAILALSACADRNGNGSNGEPGGEESVEKSVRPGYFPQAESGDPVSGGTLTFADLSEVRSLDPSQVIPTGASGGTALSAVYDQVVRLNVETQEYEPRLAESVEANDDFTEWTITFRSGINFSDGTPLNADAVVGSMNWWTSQPAYDMALVGPLWGGVEKVDDLTVKITLRESWATFESMLARSLGFIVAPAAIAGDEFVPIGAGAFTFESYAPSENLILKANPDHWDGAPYIDELRLVWLGADQTKYEALDGGTVHAAYVQDPLLVEDAFTKDRPRVTTLSNNGQLLLINHAEGHPGAYPEVRKAMAHAVDHEAISQRTTDGVGFASKTLFAPISRWYDDSVPVNEVDPARATELLEEAKAAGFDGKVTLLGAESPLNREVMLTLQAQLESVGFEVETEFVRNIADYISRIYGERNFSVSPSGLSLQEHDPWLQMYVSMHSAAPSNVIGNNDPEMDALLDELRQTPLEEAQDVISRIETHYQEAVPTINYRHYTPTIVWDEDVHGVIGLNETMVDFGKAWIQP